MTRNQKIALGCGGAGCLGLLVVGIAAGVFFYFFSQASTTRRNANINFNRNSNFNINANENENTNSNDDNSNSNSSSSASADSLSEDDKHKLFQAAATAGDTELQRRVWVKIGILNDDFTQGDKFTEFATAHFSWAVKNYRWIADNLNTQEKARAYVNEHLP